MVNNIPFIISIVLDLRREKTNGKYPVKLRVYSKTTTKKRLYSIGVDFTEKEFDTIWVNGKMNKLKGKDQERYIFLQSLESRANKEAQKLSVFSFEKFEKKLFRKSSDNNNVQYHYGQAIDNCVKKGSIGYAENFKNSLNSLTVFNDQLNDKGSSNLTFDTITVDWLEAYEKYMLKNGRSVATIGIYLRALRVVFNNAIEEQDINKDLYPFGKRKYQIPQSSKVKKALTNDELKVLYNAVPKTNEQEKAKDFWFFSYSCNGMNNKDIAMLRYTDLGEEKFSYYRAKTFSRSRVKSKIEIYLNDYSKQIIKKYGVKDRGGYVFPVLDLKDNEEIRYRKIKNFTRFIDQHIKILAKDNHLSDKISSYWARHSFATNSIRKGASMEFISEALNHSDMKVTEKYFAGFEDTFKKEFASTLMDF